MDADERQWFIDNERKWAGLERKFSGLIIQFGGASFAFVLGMLLMPQDGVAAIGGLMLWFGVVMISLSGCDVERCRQWREWNGGMARDPLTWPWPTMPSEA